MLAGHHPADDWAALDSARYYASARLGVRGWHVGGVGRRLFFAVIHPHLVPAYYRLLRKLPVETMVLSALPAGRLLYDRWSRQSWRKAASHACLLLPSDADSYLRGRHRQAVRTNLHRADKIRLTCRPIPTDWGETKRSLHRGTFASLVKEIDRIEQRDAVVKSWAVFDSGGQVLGRAVALVDERTAVLLLLHGPMDLSVAHQTRYLLHTAVVADLIRRGVRNLVIESILGAPPGLKYFAARLGYRACRIQVVSTGRVPALS
ncbi:MAG TPA: hypothetical protein VII50_04275 [Acidothermaceae bacterium]